MKKIVFFSLAVVMLFCLFFIPKHFSSSQTVSVPVNNTQQAAVSSAEVPRIEPVCLNDINADEKTRLDYLKESLAEAAKLHIECSGQAADCYTGNYSADIVTKYPEKFDLRDSGFVTPVKNQEPFGTCWAFGTIGAVESTILSYLGLSYDEYVKINGEPLDLSEKHLVWFSGNALPSLDAYSNSQYPYDKSQADEGHHYTSDLNIYNEGGNYMISSSVFASGVGPVSEKQFPYRDSKGKLDSDGDWSIPEENRFILNYDLIDANVLPAPATIDEDGEYHFNELGILAIKHELMAGRGVGVSFLAYHSRSADSLYKLIKEEISEKSDDEQLIDFYAKVWSGVTDYKTLSDKELQKLIKFRLKIKGMNENLYDFDALHLSVDDLYKVFIADNFGESINDMLSDVSSRMNMTVFTDKDGKTVFAQYQEKTACNHCVCCVGWDDTFSATNFPADRRPPADGALILKNSWGDGWGMDGYFYLSYYDRSIVGCESFNILPENESRLEILEKDFMPVELFSSTLFDKPVYTGNILETETDGVPQSICVLTGDFNTEYTVSLYLLNKDAVVPNDGILLDSVTGSSLFGGYHRINLSRNTYIPSGSRLGITVVERVNTDDGLKYSLVTTSSTGKKSSEYDENTNPDPNGYYYVGIVNPGESFISFEKNRWIDWSEEIDYLHKCGGDFDYISYDNLSTKIYSYYYEDMIEKHNLSHLEIMPGGQAAVCPECGYVLNILNTAS